MVKRLLLAENVPCLNKGEETILQGMLESFNSLGDFQLSMLSTNPQLDKSRYGSKIQILDIRKYLLFFGDRGFKSRLSKIISSMIFLLNHIGFLCLFKLMGSKVFSLYRSPIWKEYIISDVIIIGHNGAFGIGGGPSIPVIGYPIFMSFFAKKMNKVSILYAGSIKDPKTLGILTRMAYRFALEHLDLITLRENISYERCIDLGVKNESIYVTSDLAFLMKPETDDRIYEIMAKEGLQESNVPLIGMTVTREKANIAYPHLDPDQSYNEHIRGLVNIIDEIISNTNALFVFLPHCIGPDPFRDDRLAAKDIYSRSSMKDHIILIETEYNAAELKGLIGKFDLFIGERIHSVINAMSMSVPVIALSNEADERLEIIRMFGQKNAIYPIEDLQSQPLVNKICDILVDSMDLREIMAAQLTEAIHKSMLNGSLLHHLVTSQSE